MRKIIFSIFFASLLLVGCNDDQLAEVQAELQSLKDIEIASLKEQVDNINSSIGSINAMSSELEAYIAKLEKVSSELQTNIAALSASLETVKAELQKEVNDSKSEIQSQLESAKASLEAKLAEVNSVLTVLKEKKTALNQQLDKLKNNVDTNYAKMDWIKATFATIESQNAILSDIATIKAHVDALSESISAAQNEIMNELKDCLDKSGTVLDKELSDAVSKLADEMKDAFAQALSAVDSEFLEALNKAVSDSRTKIEKWVSEQLKDYYTVAEAEAKILAFKNLVGSVPSDKNIQGEIDELVTKLSDAKSDLTQAYLDAIELAIKNSDETLGAAIVEQINKLKKDISDLSGRVDTVSGEITKLLAKVESLNSGIEAIDKRIEAINSSIAVLSDLKQTLKQYIEGIKADLASDDAEYYKQINDMITQLQKKTDDLQKQIDGLEKYVGTLPAGVTQENVVEWVKNIDQTIKKQFESYSIVETIAEIKKDIEEKIKENGGKITDVSTILSTIIDDSKGTIDSWIDEKLTAYHDITKIDYKLDSLKTALTSSIDLEDEKLKAAIDTLEKEFDEAVEQFTKDYAEKIAEAITTNQTVTSKILEDAIKEVQARIEEINKRIATIETNIKQIRSDLDAIKEALEGNKTKEMVGLKDQIKAIQDFIDKSGYNNLQAFVDYLNTELGKCSTTYATADDVKALKELIYGADGTGTTSGLKYEVSKLKDLTDRLEKAESAATDLTSFLAGYNLSSDTLSSLLSSINSDLSSLKTEVYGDSTKPLDGLQTVINNILKSLYGSGMKQEGASDDSIFGRVSALAGRIISDTFSSIAYIPVSADGSADFSKSGSIWSASFDFVIRPAALVTILDNNCKMKLISTVVRAGNQLDMDIELSDKNVDAGTFTVDASIKNGADLNPIVNNGKSCPFVVLYVDARKAETGEEVSFTSKYIPLNIK